MNGIGLLVLIAVAGQLNTGQPFPATTLAQPFLQSQSTAVAQNRDWGWEFDKENTLCYIIQIPEQKLREMIDTGWGTPQRHARRIGWTRHHSDHGSHWDEFASADSQLG